MENTAIAYILVPLVSWFMSQMIKFVIKALEGDVSLRNVFASGSMPSSHAALVSGLLTTTLIIDGYRSPYFAIASVITIIVTIDAMNVRMAVGQNRKAILRLYENFPVIKRREVADDELRTFKSLGHTPAEVVAGLLIGSVSALIILFSRIQDYSWITARPPRSESQIYFAVALAVMLQATLLSWLLARRRRGLATVRRLRSSIAIVAFWPALLSLIFSVMQQQDIKVFTQRYYIFVFLIWSFFAFIYFAFSLYRLPLKDMIAEERREIEHKKALHRSKQRVKKQRRKKH